MFSGILKSSMVSFISKLGRVQDFMTPAFVIFRTYVTDIGEFFKEHAVMKFFSLYRCLRGN